eukprot:CAMPEP_0194260516 /NCGR_PEP_ID=MMETSP0158-20130606/45553_1 /TAXON_ID=33649 /ORGANISM="Thalassionema nitzschioides, Strain L26-B" /LENGTH=30 /DNA_ID= /DNA_START= /DNA_END= /DNA_ORIENTATION=
MKAANSDDNDDNDNDNVARELFADREDVSV